MGRLSQAFSRKMGLWAEWAAAGIGFSLPISTAGDNILLAVMLAFWLIGGRFRERIDEVRDNPIVLPAMALLGMYVIGMFYGEVSWGDTMGSLKKAANLLLIPILIYLFRDEKVRRWAIGGFLTAMVLTLLISYLLWAGYIPANGLLTGDQSDPCVFKLRITHSVLMAFGAYLFALKARQVRTYTLRTIFALISIAALYNVAFMVSSKTGYVVVFMLATYFLISTWRWPGIIMAAVSLLMLSVIVYVIPSSVPHQRITVMIEEIMKWNPGRPDITPVGARLEFYRNSIELIWKHPLIGSGTGGFKGAYAALVRGTGMEASENPHNEYLMVTVQLGVVGLALLLWLFLVQWRGATSLSSGFEWPAVRGLVLLILSASLVTSTLIDHTEGLFYVWMSALLFAGWPVSEGRKGRERCHCP